MTSSYNINILTAISENSLYDTFIEPSNPFEETSATIKSNKKTNKHCNKGCNKGCNKFCFTFKSWNEIKNSNYMDIFLYFMTWISYTAMLCGLGYFACIKTNYPNKIYTYFTIENPVVLVFIVISSFIFIISISIVCCKWC